MQLHPIPDRWVPAVVGLMVAVAVVKKWGNSLAVRIPGRLAKQLNLTENAPVKYAVVDGNLVISRVTQQGTYSLAQLLERVTKENIHGETNTGLAAGQVSW